MTITVGENYITLDDGTISVDVLKYQLEPVEIGEPNLELTYTRANRGRNSRVVDYSTATVNGESPTSAANLKSLILAAIRAVGSNKRSVISKTAGYEIQPEDDIILCDGTFTATLHTAVGYKGTQHTVINEGSGLITVDPDGLTINDESTIELMTWDSMTITSDGANWIIT